jgi:hypothetical protein
MKENTGKHFGIYLNPPRAVELSADDFHDLSYTGLASFLISWKAVAEKMTDGGYSVWGKSDILSRWKDYKRFKDLNFLIYRQAELVQIEIPANHLLAKTVEKYFKHLILR